jgi:hypothetical protein
MRERVTSSLWLTKERAVQRKIPPQSILLPLLLAEGDQRHAPFHAGTSVPIYAKRYKKTSADLVGEAELASRATRSAVLSQECIRVGHRRESASQSSKIGLPDVVQDVERVALQRRQP